MYNNPSAGLFAAEDPMKDQFNWYGYCDGIIELRNVTNELNRALEILYRKQLAEIGAARRFM